MSASGTAGEGAAVWAHAWPPPRANPDLFGHGEAEAALLDAWGGGRLAHAWLITGPRGVGKATLAYRFARFVLAHGAGGAAPPSGGLHVAPDDPVFRRVVAGGHADLVTVERSRDDASGRLRSEIVVSDVRRAVSFFEMTAGEGGWRVAVVDAADEMNRHAANATLKLLEEPPPRALVLLVAHAPGRVLATIRSRCRRLALRPLDDDTVSRLVRRHFGDLSEAETVAVARLAEGSPGRALALAEQGGLEVYRELVRVLASLPRLDIPAVHELAARLARRDSEVAYRTFTRLFVWWLARLARGRATGQAAPEVVAGEAEVMARLAAGRALDQLVELWEKMGRLVERADSLNLDRKQVVLNMFAALRRS